VLEDNAAARMVLELQDLAKPPLLWWLPNPLWRVFRIPIGRGFRRLTVGLYHPAVRKRLGFQWNAADERFLRLLGFLIRHCWRLVPRDWRYHPRARAAWRRTEGQDSPLVETPDRNLPPPNERDDPKHYVPGR
jgi:uncharacterized protein (DUF2236 family)